MITLFTAYTDTPEWNELADITVPVMQEYADKHGYQLVVKKENDNGGYSAFPWYKTKLVLDYLKCCDDTLLWVLDVDILITTMKSTLLQHIALYLKESNAISTCRDINGINSGSYFVPSGMPRALDVITAILALEGIATSENHAMQILHTLPYYDQAIGIFPEPLSLFNKIPYHLYPEIGRREHSEGQWERGDLTCHLPGMTVVDRIRIFTELQKEIIR